MAAGIQPSAPRWFRVSLWLHRWTGLIATPFFLILCVTGSILIFHHEIDVLLGQAPPTAEASARPLSLSRLQAVAERDNPGEFVRSAFVDREAPDRVYLSVSRAPAGDAPAKLEDIRILTLGKTDGAPLTAIDPQDSVSGFVLELHAHWFAGMAGELFGGLIALLVLIALVTGIIVYAPYVRRLAFGEIRKARGSRIFQLDLHNFVGAVVAGWALLVTVTGIALSFGTLALMIWQLTEFGEMVGEGAQRRPAQIVPVDAAIAAARSARPDRDPNFVIYPGTNYSTPRHYLLLTYGREPYNERLFDVILVDAETGKVTAARTPPLYLQAITISGPLHFGDYGGLPLKLLWFATSWGALFITGNGAWLWWVRRKRRAAPASGVAGPDETGPDEVALA